MIDRVSAIRRRIRRLIYRARRWRRQAVSPDLRRCLVVLRAGDQSLHPAWLDARDQPRRLWDLHLSYFGPSDDPFPDRPADVTLSREPGPKLIGLADCFDNPSTRFPRPLESYDWIWLPDDDMLMDQHNIDAFVRLVAAYDLDLAQPALHERSYIGHPITGRHGGSLLRFTNFVEVMCPCFSKWAFDLCRPHFRDTVSSWGVDFLFPKLLGFPKRSIAIVDATTAVHTRKHGGPNLDWARNAGLDPAVELKELLARHGLAFEMHNLAVVKPDGHITEDLSGIEPLIAGDRSP
jgi:hypothetical protein